VSPSGITFELLDGAQAVAHTDDLQALRAEVYADAPYGRLEDDARFADRFRVWRRQPGFALAEARHGGFLVGYAAGMPLRPSTSWWRELTTPVPEDLTAEHPGRTFALTELLVRGSWRRQGIGGELHGLILAGRPEERATLTVLPAAAVAQAAFRAWGWHKVARTRGAEAAAPVSDVLVIALPAIKPRAEDSPWGSRLRGVPPERGVTSRQPTGQVRCVVLALGRPEPGGDADGERVAADFGEMLAEQVSGSPRVAGGGGADHFDVVALPGHRPGSGPVRWAAGALCAAERGEIGGGEAEGRVGRDREAQRRNGPVGVGGPLRPPIPHSRPHTGGDHPAVILDRGPGREQRIMVAVGLVSRGGHDGQVSRTA